MNEDRRIDQMMILEFIYQDRKINVQSLIESITALTESEQMTTLLSRKFRRAMHLKTNRMPSNSIYKVEFA